MRCSLLTNNAVIVSGKQWRDSAILTCICVYGCVFSHSLPGSSVQEYIHVSILPQTQLPSSLWKLLNCLTLCDPMDYTVHGIFQARILEWVAFPFFRGSSQPRDWTHVSCIAGAFFTNWATREAQENWSEYSVPFLGDLPDPGIKPGSPALQADSLPAQLPGKPIQDRHIFIGTHPMGFVGWSNNNNHF